MARIRKPKLVKLTIRLTLDDQQALDSIALTLERDPSWVLAKLAHLSAGTVDLSADVRRWLRGDTAFDAGLKGDQPALLVMGNPDPPVVRAARRKTVAEDPPGLQEIQAYKNEKGYHFDEEEFLAFYTANGWKQSNKPLVDWKAACVTWQKTWVEKHGGADAQAAVDDWGKGRPDYGITTEERDDQTVPLIEEDDPEAYPGDPEA